MTSNTVITKRTHLIQIITLTHEMYAGDSPRTWQRDGRGMALQIVTMTPTCRLTILLHKLGIRQYCNKQRK